MKVKLSAIRLLLTAAFALLVACAPDPQPNPDPKPCGDCPEPDPNPEPDPEPDPVPAALVRSITHTRLYLTDDVNAVKYRMTYDAQGRLTGDGVNVYSYPAEDVVRLENSNRFYYEFLMEEGRAVSVDTYRKPRELTGEPGLILTKTVSYDEQGYPVRISLAGGNYYSLEWNEGNMVMFTALAGGLESKMRVEYGELPNDFNLDLASFLTLGQTWQPLGDNCLSPLSGKVPAILPTGCFDEVSGAPLAQFVYETDEEGQLLTVSLANPEIEACREVTYTIEYEVI